MRRRRDNPYIIKVPKHGERQPLPRHLAVSMLINTTLSYAEIAKACGFEFPETIQDFARENSLREFSPSLYPWGPTLKAITILNPYPELIKRRLKRVENRGKPIWKYDTGLVPSPKHPVILLVHAGVGWGLWRDAGIREDECAWGAAVCLAKIVGCPWKNEIPEWVESHGRDRYEWLLTHEHAIGPSCWIIDDVVPLLRPVPLRGSLGIWEASAEKINPAAPLCPEHRIPFCGCPKIKEIIAGAVRTCRVCGCTEADCRQCIQKTGKPCWWVEADLCSACVRGRR